MSAQAVQMGDDGPVHWATLHETGGGYTHAALCGVEAHGYTVFRGVTCQRCIAIANDDQVSLAKLDRATPPEPAQTQTKEDG